MEKVAQPPKKLGQFMRAQREARNMGIELMAHHIGVNKNTLGGYERSERLPDIEFLAEFALATDSDFQQLLALRLNESKAPAVHKSLAVDKKFESAPGEQPFDTTLRRIKHATEAAASLGLLGLLINTQIGKGNSYTLQETALEYKLDADGLRKLLTDVPTQALRGSTHEDSTPETARSRRSDDEYVSIPFYGAVAQGGADNKIHAQGESVVDALVFKRAWIRTELHAQPADLLLMYVDGDSMEPKIRPGDVVLLDKRDTTVQRDGIYALRLNDAVLVKRLQRLPGGTVEVTSQHEAYKSFTITLADLALDFAIIGRVVWISGRI